MWFQRNRSFKMYSIFGISTVLTLFSLVNGEGQCVMRGQCETDDLTNLQKPCVYNGKPLPLTDASAIKFLKETCPSLKAGSNFEVCCDAEQVNEFRLSVDALAALFKKCPSCFYNLANVFCQLTCSPSQSSFIQVTNYTTKGKIPAVEEISYYVTENFADGLFDSCKNVQFSAIGGKAIEIACGAHMTDCSPHYWLEFMGGHDPSPYQINFRFENEGPVIKDNKIFKPMNEVIVPCSKSSPIGMACSHDDCLYPQL